MSVLRKYLQRCKSGRDIIVHGGAIGADQYSTWVAYGLQLEVEVYPITSDMWQAYGKGAGPRRNQTMLDTRPDLVLAFRCAGVSRGTDDMVARAAQAGIPTLVIGEEGVIIAQYNA